MADVVYVAMLVAFFALAALFVKGCERLVGTLQSDVEADPEPAPVDTDADAEVADVSELASEPRGTVPRSTGQLPEGATR